jgi:hypothetical protein
MKLKLKLRANKDLIVSYLTMRRAIGILGMILPLIVILGGFIQLPGEVQPSISDYYYTNMRDFFVGLMCAVSLFLVTYKGYDNLDDAVTNLCGLFAFFIAAFPTCIIHGDHARVGILQLPDTVSMYVHLASAFLFFLLLALNSMFLFTKTTSADISDAKRRRNFIYRLCGIVILASLFLLAIYVLFLQKTPVAKALPVLVLEAVMLLAFGFSWLVKGDTLFRDRPALAAATPAGAGATPAGVGTKAEEPKKA